MSFKPSCADFYCEPEDPNDAIDREFGLGKLPRSASPEDRWEIVRDDRREDLRILVLHHHSLDVRSDDRDEPIAIRVAKWKKGALRYHVCEATLAVELREAAPAFEKACELMVVHD